MAFAQEPTAPAQPERKYDHTKKPDSLKIKFYPRALRVGTDVISLVKSYTQTSFQGWEVNADVDCGKYYLAVDYGSWARRYDISPEGLYTNQGTYWRAGVDLNLLMKDPDKNMFFFGFRYARSTYNENATVITTQNGPYGTYHNDVSNSDVRAWWMELTTGLRVKMWKEFWMGYTARMKLPPSVKGDANLKSYDIPGYGRNSNGFAWGFEYQIFWRIPFGNDKGRKVSVPAGTSTENKN
jgi:hypothetical protein